MLPQHETIEVLPTEYLPPQQIRASVLDKEVFVLASMQSLTKATKRRMARYNQRH